MEKSITVRVRSWAQIIKFMNQLELNEKFRKVLYAFAKENNIKLTDKQMYYAVSKYAKECEEKGIEQQYIKHGDTFFNKAILDYVEADNE